MSNDVLIEEVEFGKLFNGEQVKLFKLRNQNDFQLNIISYGASIQSVLVKDKENKLINVALGFDTLEEYTNHSLNPYFGCTVGRVANRISNAVFTLNGCDFKLDKNNGNNCLHGGIESMSRKNWQSAIIANGVKFTYFSSEGECGFPGEVCIECTYLLDKSENKITIEYSAVSDKPTPVNLTNHAYFNLNGHDSGEKVYNHEVKFNADQILEIDADCVCSGRLLSVEKSKFDLREFTQLSERIKSNGKWPEDGFDHFFITKNNSQFKQVACVKNKKNRIKMEVFSNQNGFQFYTANFLDVKSTSGVKYGIHEAFCIECHNYPDSVNHKSFPSCILNADEEYLNKIEFKFSLE